MEDEFDRGAVKTEHMSKSIVDIMTQLSKNKGLIQLLYNNSDNPFTKIVDTDRKLIGVSDDTKISPLPFNPEAQQDDASFLRIYYNIGEFDSAEVVMSGEIHIDIVVAKSLWLINDGKRSLIRPYEIMGRVFDMVGRRSAQPIVKFEGFQHLPVNSKFDAIRLYANTFNVKG